jgi:hypothetical protein
MFSGPEALLLGCLDGVSNVSALILLEIEYVRMLVKKRVVEIVRNCAHWMRHFHIMLLKTEL